MLQCEDPALRNEEIIINIKAFMGYRLSKILIFAFGYSMFEPTRHTLRHAEISVLIGHHHYLMRGKTMFME
jgi:hypothetical protein